MRSARASQATLTEGLGPNHTIAPMIVPPDGGWGWVIVMTGFLASMVIDGISYCFYLYREPMARDLSILPADISFLSALFTGFYFIGGILACSIGNYFGFRIVMILGAVVACSAYASGYILEELMYFLLIIGFIAGMSAGFLFVAGILPAGFYFDKKRSIAMGFVSCGSGMGAIIIPQVSKIFMTHFGWRLTFVFHASLFGIMIFFGLLIRPLKPVMVIIKPSSWTSIRTHRETPPDFSLFRVPTLDNISIGASSMIRSVVMGTTDYPTISQMAQDMDVISIKVRDTVDYTNTMERLQSLKQSTDFQPSISMMLPNITLEREVRPPNSEPRLPWYRCGCCRSRHATLPERPLLRTDLYYTGSLNRLDEYTTNDKHLEYHMNVTKVPTYFETAQDLTRNYTRWCCQNILHGIKSLLDYTLLKSPTFLCLALCGFSNYIAFFLPFLYGKIHLEKLGHSEYDTTLVSMIGLGNMLGRLSSGIIVTTIPKFGARTTASFTNFIAGLAAISVTFNSHIIYQFVCMVLYGFTIGFFAPLRSIIIVDFLGLNALTSATGMMILFQGCGSFLGAPLAEMALQYTGNDNAPYYVCGGSLFVSSIVLWPMRAFQRWEKKRKNKNTPRAAPRE